MNTADRYIVITRSKTENETLKKQLEKRGLQVFSYPTIRITPKRLTKFAKDSLRDIRSFDWILFTSRNGVKFFFTALEMLDINSKYLEKIYIGAVGSKTAEEIKKHNLQVNLIPHAFTTKDLGTQVSDIEGKKILLPRANIASPLLTKQLIAKGGNVVNIPIYTTTFTKNNNMQIAHDFIKLIQHNQIAGILFTSPSTVRGFMKSLKDNSLLYKILSLPILVIGPVTQAAARRYGFQTIVMSDVFTVEGMLEKLQENNL